MSQPTVASANSERLTKINKTGIWLFGVTNADYIFTNRFPHLRAMRRKLDSEATVERIAARRVR